MAEFRRDPITGRCVIIASNRANRPRHYDTQTELARSVECPFCEGNEGMTPPEIYALREQQSAPNTRGWRVRVVPNKYPALEDHGGWRQLDQSNDGISPGVGVHEVIIESSRHIVNIGSFDENQFVDVLRAYQARLRVLRIDPRWRCLLIYKNQGKAAGATLEHVHSQLIALPMLPKEVSDEVNGAHRHYESTGACIYCAMIETETSSGGRLVASTERFVALCPFAPRFAYETWILPKYHSAIFENSSDEEILDFGRALRNLILKLNVALGDPAFNYIIHTLPPQQSAESQYHWHVEVLPQVAKAAGLEWGSGIHLNSVSPEEAARVLRQTPG
jgi:UDPglucose--hexose-1-phosphate uridylyltransferase